MKEAVVPAAIVCLGAAAVDRKYRAARPLERDTSNPVAGTRSFGGVARNVAENLARLGVPTALSTLVGADEGGEALLADLARLGIDTRLVRRSESRRTAEYIAVLEPDGSLAFGLADMDIFDDLSGAQLDTLWPALIEAAWVFADCNLPSETLAELARRRRGAGFKLAVDAVSRAKARRLPENLQGIDLLFLNEAEADASLGRACPPEEAALAFRQRGAAAVALTCGRAGVVVADGAGQLRIPAVATDVVDVTGAGDAFIAATLAQLLAGRPLAEAALAGTAAAALTIGCEESVRADLSPKLLSAAMAQAHPNSR